MSTSLITIAAADVLDLPDIVRLAGSRCLEVDSPGPTPSAGFLVSNFTLDDYRNFQQQAQHLLVARIGRQLAGFVLVFAGEDSAPHGRVNRWLAERFDCPFLIVKQVCVDERFTRQRVASRLYESVFQANPNRRVFAAIVLDPPNLGSVKFHERLGFERLCEIDADDGFRRGVWSRQPFARGSVKESIP